MVKNKQEYGNFRAGTREMRKNEQGQGIWVSSRGNYFLIDSGIKLFSFLLFKINVLGNSVPRTIVIS